jgi:aspartyl-tRNA(Asn)/glutamyl-tRNA(Gln) amidotransferase subunit C
MTIEDLKETAALAHLNADENELADAFPAFEQMLGYFAAMQAADKDEAAFAAGLSGIAPEASAGGHAPSPRTVSSDHFRPDRAQAARGANAQDALNGEPQVSRLIDNAGERDGRFVVVPNVL